MNYDPEYIKPEIRDGWNVSEKMKKVWYIIIRSRECWNWQTGKTKDLVGVCSCGFKSHLPQMQKWRNWQTRTVQVRVVATP